MSRCGLLMHALSSSPTAKPRVPNEWKTISGQVVITTEERHQDPARVSSSHFTRINARSILLSGHESMSWYRSPSMDFLPSLAECFGSHENQNKRLNPFLDKLTSLWPGLNCPHARPHRAACFLFDSNIALLIKSHQYTEFLGCNSKQNEKPR
jgi:hypothetical protein